MYSRSSRIMIDGSRRSRMRLVIFAVFSGSLVSISSDSFAEGPPVRRTTYTRDQTRSMIDDLDKSLQDPATIRRRVINDRSFPHPPNGEITAELKQLRPLLRSFSNDVSQLAYALNEQIRQTPALRTLYTDALRVSAEAVSIDIARTPAMQTPATPTIQIRSGAICSAVVWMPKPASSRSALKRKVPAR